MPLPYFLSSPLTASLFSWWVCFCYAHTFICIICFSPHCSCQPLPSLHSLGSSDTYLTFRADAVLSHVSYCFGAFFLAGNLTSWYPLVDFFSFSVWILGRMPWLSKSVLADQFHSNLCSFTCNVTFFFYVFYVFLTRLWAPWRQVYVVYGHIPVKSTEEVFNTYILNG